LNDHEPIKLIELINEMLDCCCCCCCCLIPFKAHEPTSGLFVGGQMFGTVGTSKVLKLKALLRYSGELVVAGAGKAKLRGGDVSLQLRDYDVTLNETEDDDATHLDFDPKAGSKAKSTDERAVRMTMVGGLYEMRCWERRIRYV
jgi:hypothetical protein